LAKKKKSEPVGLDADSLSFEEALAKLESIVQQLEGGRLGLGESLTRYEEGVKHLKKCYHLLEGAERKIELLLKVGPQGEAETEPLDEDERSLTEKADGRSRRRSSKTQPVDNADEDGGVDVPGGLF